MSGVLMKPGLTVITLFSAWFLGWWAKTLEGVSSQIVGWLSPATHFAPASLGLLRLSDLVFFAGITALCLYATVISVEARRASGGRD